MSEVLEITGYPIEDLAVKFGVNMVISNEKKNKSSQLLTEEANRLKLKWSQ